MADEQTQDGVAAQPTQEERLRALTNDRKRKVHGKANVPAGPATTRPGDLVDAVRERSSMDRGKDQPL
jgi:hypothetical protein